MVTPIYDNIVYVFGPDTTYLLPTDRVNIRIGKARNVSKNIEQRLSEHKRHCPSDVAYDQFVTHLNTNNPDDFVRLKLCREFPAMFGATHNVGRDVIQGVLVSDIPFLLDHVARYINFADTGNAKKFNFPMRPEQDDCVEKTCNFFSDPNNAGREFLWAAKMRFGKSFSFLQVAVRRDARLILILTIRPTDTKQAWIDAMDHVDFPDYVFIDASLATLPILPDPNKRTIIFASLQDFARLENGKLKEKFKHFPNLRFDLGGKDEFHIGFDTDNTIEALSQLNCKHWINLSGTPFRALLDGRFDNDAIFTWSYIDEQRARTDEINTLGDAHAQQEGQYYWLSPLKIFTILLSNELYDDSDQFSDDEGFNFAKLFATTEDHNGKTLFLNDLAVDHWLYAISHGTVMPFSKQAHNCHKYMAINLKHTLWYLPNVAACKLLADKLKKHPIFKEYDIVVAADNNNGEGNNTSELVKSKIADIESRGNLKKKKGTITLTCGKLSHGVSIPEWGAVFHLSDMTSAQLYFQLIFRGQTPWKDNKHECYVFDFKPNRTLQCMFDAAVAVSGTTDPKPKLTEMLNVFNVLSYEGNTFKDVDASDLISKLESGWGRSTSLMGIQNVLSELPFDLNVDPDLGDELDDIEDGSSSKNSSLDVGGNSNSPNGKTRPNKDKGGDSGGGDKDKDKDKDSDGDKDKSDDERKKLRIKTAMKALPLYWTLVSARSCDELITSLGQDAGVCKIITGMPARSVKKILSNQSPDKQQTITKGIVRFREEELKDHASFQDSVRMTGT